MRCLSVGSLFREGLTRIRCLSVGVGPCVGLFVVDCRGLTPVRYLLIGPGLFVGLAVGWLACWSLRVWLFVCLLVGWLVGSLLSSCFFLWAPPRRAFLAGDKERSESWSLRPRTPSGRNQGYTKQHIDESISITRSLVFLGISYRAGKAFAKFSEL